MSKFDERNYFKHHRILLKLVVVCVALAIACFSISLDYPDHSFQKLTLKFKPFHSIVLESDDDVTVRFGPNFSAKVNSPKDVLGDLIIARESDIPDVVAAAKAELSGKDFIASLSRVLLISRKSEYNKKLTTQQNIPLKINIIIPEIYYISKSGDGLSLFQMYIISSY